jgi:zinc D-Ala-D-Ala carboxypeptidase
VATGGKYTFKRSLTIGASGEDVRQLQLFLNKNGFTIARAGAGSPGKESTFFGPATRLALIRYQLAKKITPAAGFFGPTTRARVMSGK